MRFNQNAAKILTAQAKGSARKLQDLMEDYNAKLGGKLSDGSCPGHYGQGPGNGEPCYFCDGEI